MKPDRRDTTSAVGLFLIAAFGAAGIGYTLLTGRLRLGSRGRYTIVEAAADPGDFWCGIGFFSLIFILLPPSR